MPHGLNGAKLFDLSNLDEAIEHAARLNTSAHRNVYISAATMVVPPPGTQLP